MSRVFGPRSQKAGLIVAGVAGVAAVLAVSSVRGATVREPLVPFDTDRWERGDHPLGRGSVRAANTAPAGRVLSLRLEPRDHEGAEIVSRERFGDGTFRARLRLPEAPGSLTGFFLYEPPDLASEIDVEVPNSREGRVLFTIYHDGRERHHERRLGFDPTAAAHEYGFHRDGERVRFVVDGRILHEFSGPLPRAPMRLHLNTWWPRWLEGRRDAPPSHVLVEWVERPTGGG